MLLWILLLVYKTGLVEQIDELRPASNGATSLDSSERRADDTVRDARDTADVPSHEIHEELWQSLSPNHWPTLFAFYNMSLTGRSVTSHDLPYCLLHVFANKSVFSLVPHLST